jgi:hypothetical protein
MRLRSLIAALALLITAAVTAPAATQAAPGTKVHGNVVQNEASCPVQDMPFAGCALVKNKTEKFTILVYEKKLNGKLEFVKKSHSNEHGEWFSVLAPGKTYVFRSLAYRPTKPSDPLRFGMDSAPLFVPVSATPITLDLFHDR